VFGRASWSAYGGVPFDLGGPYDYLDAIRVFGSKGSSAGDVNGDGFDDLIVGDAVIFGKADWNGVNSVTPADLDGTNGFRLLGGTGHGKSAGDVNGDGYDDLIVADPGAGRLYVPQTGYTTGDIDIHDVALDGERRPIFVATLFSCLATVSETHSLRPLWKPRFISKLAAEDRCHLNGLAMKDGAVAQTDVTGGWREHRDSGGILIDVASGETIASGFSMPHSPRLHKGMLYLHDSGTGRFGTIDVKSGKFEPIAFCPGYLRGLAFVDRFAVVGISRPRPDTRTLKGLKLDEVLAEKGVSARCGILVIDLKRGDIVHWLDIQGIVQELDDVIALPGVLRPMALGFKSDEIRRSLTIEDIIP
jgi:uncharacterized protein (TIGR03032 family)